MRFLSLGVLLAATELIVSAADSRLRFDPAQPHPGGTITVSFDAKGGPLEKSESLTLVYGESPVQSRRTPMVRTGALFSARVPVSRSAYLWCWVEDPISGEKDTDRGMPWDTYVYDDHGLPLKGARQLRAELYQRGGQPIDKNTASLNLLEEELRAFPSNTFARVEWWSLRFQESGYSIQMRDRIVSEIAAYLGANADQVWAYQAVIGGYQGIGRTKQALEVARAFVRRFPENDSLDSDLLSCFRLFGDATDLEGLPRLSKRWIAEPYYWESLFMSYQASHASPEKLRLAGEHWVATLNQGENGAQKRITIAEAWLSSGVDPAAAERIAQEALKVAETGPKFLKNLSPDPSLTPQTVITPIYRSTLGWALFQQHRYPDALRELERAVSIAEKEKIPVREVYYRLGQTLEQLNRPDDAMEAYIKEFALGGKDDALAWKAAAAIYSKAHGGMAGFEVEIRSRANDLALNAAQQEPIEEMNQKISRFDLRRADGQAVRMSSYDGKAVIVDFWATWCGACAPSLANSQQLAKQFPGKVVVVAVSTDGEETRGSAQAYLTERGYDFVLLFDDERQRDLQVHGVPTRFLLDRSGRVRARQLGSGPYADMIFGQKLQRLLKDPQE